MQQITDETLQGFKEYLFYEERSAATIEKYVRDVSAFRFWCGEREVTKALVLEYKQKLMEEYAPASVNATISSLNSFFMFNHWYELKVKSLRIQKQIFMNQEKSLSKDEYNRLLLAAKRKKNRRLYYLIQTICATGIRVSELRYITAEAVEKRQAAISCKGKMRIVMLPKQLCSMLRKYMHEQKIKSGPVFISKNGNPLDRSNIWSEMKKLCDFARVSKEKVFPHNLRHLFARTFYSLQKDVVRLADILGHSSINTTRIYTMEPGDVHRMQLEHLGLLSI